MNQPYSTNIELTQPARLLLVDDEPGLRTAVEAYLQDEGFEELDAASEDEVISVDNDSVCQI